MPEYDAWISALAVKWLAMLAYMGSGAFWQVVAQRALSGQSGEAPHTRPPQQSPATSTLHIS
jgi:hypothetical protein